MRVKLCTLNEIPDQGTSKIDFFDREVLVFKDKGQPKACSIIVCTWVAQWN